MKHRTLISILFLLVVTASCQWYKGEMDYYRQLLSSTEGDLQGVRSSIETYNRILEIFQTENYFIKSVTPIMEGNETVGYSLVFSCGQTLSIFLGKDGEKGDPGIDGQDGMDGREPVLELLQDSDGKSYWSVNGFWIVDAYGNRIASDAADGISPIIKLDGKIWMISFDGGTVWTPLGSSVMVSVSIFKTVNVSGENMVEIYLQDGEVLHIPFYSRMELSLDKPRIFTSGNEQQISYIVNGYEGNGEEIEYSYTISEGWKARIISDKAYSGKVVITAPERLQSSADLLFFCSCNGQTLCVHQKLEIKE